MTNKDIETKVFLVIFIFSFILIGPYIVEKYVIDAKKESEEIEYNDQSDEEIIEHDEQLDNSNVSNYNTVTSNIISNQISNIVSNVSSNKTSNEQSNKVSNKSSNKVSNKTSNKVSNKTSNKTSNKVNTVSNPTITYTGFKTVDNSYFNDALFIGDSRTVGIRDYGTLKNADYFCDVGMSTNNIYKKTLSFKSVGKVTIEQLLSKKQYGKVYVMLGINEIGAPINNIYNKYLNLINLIRKKQPNAIIFIEGNLHVAAARNNTDKSINNDRINKLNNKISKIANNQNIFYIDINEYFDDANGNLKSDYTSDNTHVYAKYYKNWCQWLKEHGI